MRPNILSDHTQTDCYPFVYRLGIRRFRPPFNSSANRHATTPTEYPLTVTAIIAARRVVVAFKGDEKKTRTGADEDHQLLAKWHIEVMDD